MANDIARQRLINMLELRFDYYSARNVLNEILSKMGLEKIGDHSHDPLTPEELERAVHMLDAFDDRLGDILARVCAWIDVEPPDAAARAAAEKAAAEQAAKEAAEKAAAEQAAKEEAAEKAAAEQAAKEAAAEKAAAEQGAAEKEAAEKAAKEAAEKAAAEQAAKEAAEKAAAEQAAKEAAEKAAAEQAAKEAAEKAAAEQAEKEAAEKAAKEAAEQAAKEAAEKAAAEQAVAEKPTACDVVFRLSGAPAAPGTTVVLVGEGELLGSWNPEAGLTAAVEDGGLVARKTLAVGAALDFKIVVLGAEEPVWEPGANHTMVAPEAASHEVTLDWGQGGAH